MQRVAALAGRPLRIALLTSSRFWRGSSMVFAALARGLADRGHTTTALAAYEPVATGFATQGVSVRSEEHTSELQSRLHLVCRLLLEKKKRNTNSSPHASSTNRIYSPE